MSISASSMGNLSTPHQKIEGKSVLIQDNFFHCFADAARLPNLRSLHVHLVLNGQCGQETLHNDEDIVDLHIRSTGSDLPASIELLTNLQALDLINVIEVSREIGTLTRLQFLKISANQELEVNPLPSEMSQLKSLRTLMIHRVRYWESLRFIGYLENLEVISFRFYLGELPQGIFNLHQLTRLDLASCELKKLDGRIEYLKTLKHLILSRNNLTTLPDSIGGLSELETLDLYGNKLYKLTRAVLSLTNLKTLDLASNNLKDVPQGIKLLPSLEKLHLEGNPFREL